MLMKHDESLTRVWQESDDTNIVYKIIAYKLLLDNSEKTKTYFVYKEHFEMK